MGFTPLAGLVMATRSGDVDPGLLHRSGLAGLTDGSGDLRDIVGSDEQDSQLALDVYLHRLRREIAAMAAAMNGLDVLVFTGGVDEHQPSVRAAASDGLAFLGVHVAASANKAANTAGDLDITAAGAPDRSLVVLAREDVGDQVPERPLALGKCPIFARVCGSPVTYGRTGPRRIRRGNRC